MVTQRKSYNDNNKTQYIQSKELVFAKVVKVE